MTESKDKGKILREQYREELLEPLDPDALIFTTFAFGETFFEDNILGWIGADTKRLQTLGERDEAETWAAEHGVSVFFEPTVYNGVSKRLTYPTYPVTPPDGVFHPKMIVASGEGNDGKRRVRLLVASANLTRSGWGKNREVAATVDVENSATASPLLDLLHWIFERTDGSKRPSGEGGLPSSYGEVVDRLEELANHEANPGDSKLIVTIPDSDTGSPSMMSTLARTEGTLRVFSPYFHPTILSYLRKDKNLGDRPLEIVPAVSRHEEVEMPKESLDELRAANNVQLARAEVRDGKERFDHFKLFEWDSGLALGSHNATCAALGNGDGGGYRNVEVSLILKGRGSGIDTRPVNDEELKGKAPEKLDRPGNREGLDFTISVLVDWEDSSISINLHPSKPTTDLDDYTIQWNGMNDRPDGLELGDAASRDSWDLEEVGGSEQFVGNKSFTVRDSAGNPVYVGSIVERQWRDFRRDAIETSVKNCLARWQPDVDFHKQSSSSSVSLHSSHDRESSVRNALVGDQGDVFENYFFLYQATRVMLDRFEQFSGAVSPESERRLLDMLHKRAGSITNIISIVEDSQESDDTDGVLTCRRSLFNFLFVEELAVVVQQLTKMAERWPEKVSNRIEKHREKVRQLRKHRLNDIEGLDTPVGEFLLDQLRMRTGGWQND